MHTSTNGPFFAALFRGLSFVAHLLCSRRWTLPGARGRTRGCHGTMDVVAAMDAVAAEDECHDHAGALAGLGVAGSRSTRFPR